MTEHIHKYMKKDRERKGDFPMGFCSLRLMCQFQVDGLMSVILQIHRRDFYLL